MRWVRQSLSSLDTSSVHLVFLRLFNRIFQLRNMREPRLPSKKTNQRRQQQSQQRSQRGIVLDTRALVVVGGIFLVGFAMGWMANGYSGAASGGPAVWQGAAGGGAPQGDEHDHPELVDRNFTSELVSIQARLGQNPTDAGLLVQLGNTYFDQGIGFSAPGLEAQRVETYQNAIKAYEKAIAAGAENADVVTDLGISHRRAGNFKKAEELFVRATTLSPTHVNSWLNLGILRRYDLDDPAGARAAWERLVSMHPTSQAAQQIRGELALLPPKIGGTTIEEFILSQ